MKFEFPQPDESIEDPQEATIFYAQNNPTELIDRQLLVDSLKSLSHESSILGETFEWLYFTAKKYASQKKQVQDQLVNTFLHLFRKFREQDLHQISTPEEIKAWAFLLIEMLVTRNDQVLIELMKFIRLTCFSQQYRDSLEYILHIVTRIVDDKLYRVLSDTKDSINPIHLLMSLHDAVHSVNDKRKAILNKILDVVKTDCKDQLQTAVNDNLKWAGFYKLLKISLITLNTEKDAQSIKNIHNFLSLVLDKIPTMFVKQVKHLVVLLQNDNKSIRQNTTELLGQLLKHCMEQNEYANDAPIMLNLIEARLFDKSISVRRVALQSLKQLAKHLFKLITCQQIVALYQKVLAHVTDDKPSIRKEALLLIEAMTRVIADKLIVHDDTAFGAYCREHEEIEGLKRQVKAEFEKFTADSSGVSKEAQFNNQPSTLLLVNKVILKESKLKAAVEFKGPETFEARQAFIETIPKVVSALSILISSAKDSVHDVLEVLRLLAFFKQSFPNEPELPIAIRKALTLIFNSKQPINDGITKFFMETYFNKNESASQQVALLKQLVIDAKVADLVCIEEIMLKCNLNKDLARSIVTELLNEFKSKPSRLALYLISLVNPGADERILSRVIQMGTESIEFFPQLCKGIATSEFIESFMLPALMQEAIPESQQLLWFQAMEQVLNTYFTTSSKTKYELFSLTINIRDTLLDQIAKDDQEHYFNSAKVIFTVAHLSLKLLEIAEKTRDDDIQGKLESEIAEIDQKAELFTEDKLIQESKINQVYVACRGFVEEALKTNNWTLLDQISLQALCKFTCVSKKIAADNLDLIFQIVNSNAPYTCKQTIIIAIGDLYKRFTNLIEDRSDRIYVLLEDSCAVVRQSTLYMLAQLILSETIKPRDRIVDICVLLNDSAPTNRNLCENLVHEMFEKNSQFVQSHFRTAFKKLCSMERLSRETFYIIAKTLMRFGTNEKQSESKIVTLTETLADWCKVEYPDIQRRNASFCLTQIPYFVGGCKEKPFLVLAHRTQILQECLDNDTSKEVKANLIEVCSQLKFQMWYIHSTSMSKTQKEEIREQIVQFKKVFGDQDVAPTRKRDLKMQLKQESSQE